VTAVLSWRFVGADQRFRLRVAVRHSSAKGVHGYLVRAHYTNGVVKLRGCSSFHEEKEAAIDRARWLRDEALSSGWRCATNDEEVNARDTFTEDTIATMSGHGSQEEK